LRRFEALPDPALRCGENSRPGKVRHRLEDSREAILWFHDTQLSSDSDLCFEENVANKGNRVAKFLALATFGLGENREKTGRKPLDGGGADLEAKSFSHE
jgi:hypothetical protein